MATPPQNDDTTRVNAPLNFRHSNTLITTKVPHYPTKLTTGMSIIPGWNRPNANGKNANINDKDYNGPDFKARPLKQWRQQLRIYDYNGPTNNSRSASISDLDRPGTTVYHFTPDCTCVTGEGGNSYIISNNKFGYETKDDKYSKVTDTKIQNNGFMVVPYDATAAQINDPTNPAYKVLTGIHNTVCINCSPQGNLIRSGVAQQSQAFFSYSNDKLGSRCQTYEQNISTTKSAGCNYFDAQGNPLWPNDSPNGPQVVAPVNFEAFLLYNKPCNSQTIYKPSNVAFAKQGAVAGSTRLKKLVSDTMTMNGSSFYSAKGAEEANIGKYQGTNLSSNYYVKTNPGINSCRGPLPTPPILRVVDNDSYSITFSWQELGNSFCRVVYYTVTYYAINIIERIRGEGDIIDDGDIQDFLDSNEAVVDIQDFLDSNEAVVDIQDFLDINNNNNNNNNNSNNEIVIYNNQSMGTKNGVVDSNTVYTDNENNIRFNIISAIRTKNVAPNTTSALQIENISSIVSLNPSTNYLLSMTSTNGNGTSIRSNTVLSSTALDSNIIINIEPYADNYTYSYNYDTPVVLTVTISSIHSSTPFILSITNATNQNVAVINKLEELENTYEVRLNNAGTFNLYATQARGLGELRIYGNSVTTSPLLTISRDTPEFTDPWDIFPGITLFIQGIFPFTPPTFIYPRTQPDDLTITYKILNSDGIESNIITFIDNFSNVRVNSYGKFQIRATSAETQNYISTSTTSAREYSTTMNDPIIEFPNSFVTNFTYRAGLRFNIIEANVVYPPEPQSDVEITTYSIVPILPSVVMVGTTTVSDVATINGITVTILNVGSFRIRANTIGTPVYNSAEVQSPPITINIATPRLSSPWYLFTDINSDLFVGRTYNFNPPVFEDPYPGPSFPQEIPSFTYTSSNELVASVTGNSVIIKGEGNFSIKAVTTQSRNYNKIEIDSEIAYSILNRARVVFPPNNFVTNITYGDEYSFIEAEFSYPRDRQEIGGTALLSGSTITVSIEQYNYFIIGRIVTADVISGVGVPPIAPINVTVTQKRVERVGFTTRYVIYISNNTGISATVTNIIQHISDLRDFNITYSIDSKYSRIATMDASNNVTIIGVGDFKIIATTTQTNTSPVIINSTMDSPLITVNKATPIIKLDDLFQYALQVGSSYSFAGAYITSPDIIPANILPITYISLNPNIVTIPNAELPSLIVNLTGSFRIRAETKPSDNYNLGYVESLEEISTVPTQPVIIFDPSQNFGPFTYGETYSFVIEEVIFKHPQHRPYDIGVTYDSSERYIASVTDRTVTIYGAGNFTISAVTNKTVNFIQNIISREVIVLPATPTFERWDVFTRDILTNATVLFVGQTVEINLPRFKNPSPGLLSFYDYTSLNPAVADVSTILETSETTGVTVTRVFVTIKQMGEFTLRARTFGTSNYKAGFIKSEPEDSTQENTPIIAFPTTSEGFITEITYGDLYTLREAVFKHPNPNTIIPGTATLILTSTDIRIRLENIEQYNAINVEAFLTVENHNSTSITTIRLSVTNKMIDNGLFVTVTLTNENMEGNLPIGNMMIQNIRQNMTKPRGVSIIYSIPLPSPIPTIPDPYIHVATINASNNVTINRAGSFIFSAVTTPTDAFVRSNIEYSEWVNVKAATPTIEFVDNDLFKNIDLLVNGRYNFIPAIVRIPTTVPHEVLEIVYTCEPAGVVTIFPRDTVSNTIPIRVNRQREFQIKATTVATNNFISNFTLSNKEVGVQLNTPQIYFPSVIRNVSGTFINELTYGFQNTELSINVYVPEEAVFRYPEPNNVPSDLRIDYSISVEDSHIATLEMLPITKTSTLLGVYTSVVPVITIRRVGDFMLIAETKETPAFRSAVPAYMKFNIIRATPTFVDPWYPFTDSLLTGTVVTFSPPRFITPNPIPSEILPFTFRSFTSSDTSVVSILSEQRIIGGVTLFTARIHKVGEFSITAKTEISDNYNVGKSTSVIEDQHIIQNVPTILFPGQDRLLRGEPREDGDFVNVITYGDRYTLRPAFFYEPSAADITSFGLRITHSIPLPSPIPTIPNPYIPVATVDASNNVTINRAGSFTIQAETNKTPAFGKKTITQSVTVNQFQPVITFPSDIFPSNDALFVNNSYTFLPATVTIPAGVSDTIPAITYTSGNVNATIDSTTRTITILNAAVIEIIASTSGTTNFFPATATYSRERGVTTNQLAISVPSIVGFPNSPITITLGRTYTFQPSIFENPTPLTIVRNNLGLSIGYTVVAATTDTITTNVATINGTTITLITSGTFRIRARTIETPQPGIFTVDTVFSPIITVIRATPTIAFLNPAIIFRNTDLVVTNLVVNGSFTFLPAVVTIPTGITPEVLTIGYTCEPAGVVTITNILAGSVTIFVNRRANFIIRATTVETNNFNTVNIQSNTILGTGIELDTPRIGFSIPFTTFLTTLTYGVQTTGFPINTYAPTEAAVFTYPTPPTGLTISYSIPATVPPVASVVTRNVTLNSVITQVPVITILRAGNFTLTAVTNEIQDRFRNSSISIPIIVQRATPLFVTPWNLFTTSLLTGTIRSFILPQFSPLPPVPSDIPPFILSSFTSSDPLTASIESSTVGGVTVFSARIRRVGNFIITARTTISDNYNVGEISSAINSAILNTPIIHFPGHNRRESLPPIPPINGDFVNVITYGDPYTLRRAFFETPTSTIAEEFGVRIGHFIPNSSTVATMNPITENVTINGAGTFTIRAQTNQTPAFAIRYIDQSVNVRRARPVITFPTDIFPNDSVLFVGSEYVFLPAIATIPSGTESRRGEIVIQYRVQNTAFAEMVSQTDRRIRILGQGNIAIIASTNQTANFDGVPDVTSPSERGTTSNIPVISAPSIISISNNQVTFGQSLTLQASTFSHPTNATSFGLSIGYVSTNTNVATINGTAITLIASGTFTIRARTIQAPAAQGVIRPTFTEAVENSPIITVIRATPVFNPIWTPIANRGLFIGDVVPITAPIITAPMIGTPPAVPAEIFPFTYTFTSTPPGIVTITPAQPSLLASSITINNVIGTFRLIATTNRTIRYESIPITSSGEIYSTTRRIPVIAFPNNFQTAVTFGGTYTLQEPTFIVPSGPDPATSGVIINYSIAPRIPTPPPFMLTAQSSGIRGTTIGILAVGTFGNFRIRATTTANNLFDSVTLDSPVITVTPVTPSFRTPWNPFPDIITTNFVQGSVHTITPPIIDTPMIGTPPAAPAEIFPIVYTATPESTVTITVTTTGTTVRLDSTGDFTITASTTRPVTNNYNIGRVTSVNSITALPPRRIRQDGETLVFTESSIATVNSPTFVREDPRGTGSLEWFAVVDNRSLAAITNYARGTNTAPFIPTGLLPTQTTPVPFRNIVTTLMTNMTEMFNQIPTFNQDITSWDTVNVTLMNGMFNNARDFNQPIGVWNTSAVTDMSVMFAGATNFNNGRIAGVGGIFNWNTSLVTNMNNMFANAERFNQNIGNWNTGQVIGMRSMFSGAANFNNGQLAGVGGSFHWNTGGTAGVVPSGVEDMSFMFQFAVSFNQFIGTWDTSRANNMTSMFQGARVFNQRIDQWNTSRVVGMNGMFASATAFNQNINNAGGGRWDTGLVTNMGAMFQEARAFNGIISDWNTSSVRAMGSMFNNATAFNQPIGNWNTISVTDMGSMFSGASVFNNGRAVAIVTPLHWNTSNVISMNAMFRNASNFNQFIGNWNTVNVTSMQSMFTGATHFNQNIGDWNTGAVLDMSFMFQNAISFNQSLAFSTQNVRDMSFMFQGAIFFNAYVEGFNTSQVTNMTSMFQGATRFSGGINSRATRWNTSRVTDMSNMFRDATAFNSNFSLNANVHTRLTIRMGGSDWQQRIINNDMSLTNGQPWGPDRQWFDVNFAPQNQIALQFRFFAAYVTTLYSISTGQADVVAPNGNLGRYFFTRTGVSSYSATFAGTTQVWIYDLPIAVNSINWNTAAVTNMHGMFRGATSFNGIIGNWATWSVTDMSFMFFGATAFNQNLTWSTHQVRNMSGMFLGARAFNGLIGSWDTNQVTDMSNMFDGASVFNQSIFSTWNTMSVTNMSAMFSGAVSFNNAGETNFMLGSWNTSQVTDMSFMFLGAVSFNNSIIGNWNTSQVRNMNGMFRDARAFNGLISGWNTGQVRNMAQMFNGAGQFNRPVESWNTSQVTDMSFMFNGASAFNQNLGPFQFRTQGWDTGQVRNMLCMFQNALVFNSNVSNFNTGQVTDMSFMFNGAARFNWPINIWNVQTDNFLGFRRSCPLTDTNTPTRIRNSATGGR